MKLSVCPSQTGLILVLTLFIDQGGEVVWWLVGAYYCEAVRVLTQSSLDVEEDRGFIDEMAAIDLCYLLRGRWLEAEKGAYGRHSTKVPGLSQCEQELGQPLESRKRWTPSCRASSFPSSGFSISGSGVVQMVVFE